MATDLSFTIIIALRSQQHNSNMENLSELLKKLSRSVDSMKTANQDITYYQGRAFMANFSWECVRYAYNEWQMPENSVIISSYFKTGTAWSAEITRQILCHDNENLLRAVKSLPMLLHVLEFRTTKKFELYPYLPLKVFATHMPAELFNFRKLKESNSKVIYMYRNPKDQAVSWYHFVSKLPTFNAEQRNSILGSDWDDFFDKYTAGEHPTGMPKGEWYPDHLKAWMDQANVDENILPVEYESLKKNFPREVKRIAKFLGVELSEEDITRISENCTISAMKKDAEADKSGFLKANVRKGEVGGWKEQLTSSQSQIIDRIMENKLAGTGIKFTYEL